ncbi:MAG: IPT/TIG domain-containing protein [Patescibacteria group bacterium]
MISLRKRSILKISVIAVLFMGGFLSHQEVLGADPAFERDLKIGDRGDDVKELQVLLNRDPDTRLANSGAGSPGQETEYFGPITKNAVIRFQEKYSSEILSPLGLQRGTGYFGSSTKAKIDDLLSEKREFHKKDEDEEQPEEPTLEEGDEDKEQLEEPTLEEGAGAQEELNWMHTEELMLTQPSHYSGERGEELEIYGFGFTSKNTVYFGDDIKIENVEAQSSDTIVINVPEEAESGYHNIQVKNEKGKTDNESVFFAVVDEGVTPPTVDSVSPSEIETGTEVTVHGEGFDKDWNMVRTSVNTVEGVPSPDGKSLSFKVETSFDEPDVDHIEGPGFQLDVYFYIVNENGISKEPGKFILNL